MATELPDGSRMFNYEDEQLAVRRLEFANENGHSIHLQGVSHIADPDFWRSFEKTLAKYSEKGWTIHYELIKGHEQLTRRERNKLKLFRKLSRTLAKKSSKVGLEHQRNLKYPGGSKNVDMAAWKLASQIEFSLKDKILYYVGLMLVGAIPSRYMKRFIAHILLSERNASLNPKFDKVILHDRNKLAVDAATSEKLDVFMIWGAGHLEGMTKLLQEKGYNPTASHWTPIMSVSI